MRLTFGALTVVKLTAACIALSTCTALARPPETTAGALVAGNGSLVIAGGALLSSNADVWSAIVQRRIPGRPVCVVPLASTQPEKSAQDVLSDLQRAGGAGSAVIVGLVASEPQRANDEAFAKELARCGGFFFTGGDQSRIVDVLRPKGVNSEAHGVMNDLLREGAVIAGSSAGAAMMSHPMIGGGESGAALLWGIARREEAAGVWVRDGMGFLLHGLVDQHFLARGRLGRMLAALEGNIAIPFAFGIDENTALVVHGSEARVAGASGVVFVDVRGARREPGRRGFEGARLYLLGNGDRVREDQVVPADDKPALAASTQRAAVPEDPWKESAFARLLAAFAAGPDTTLTIHAAPYTLRLAKPADFAARANAGTGPYGVPRDLFAGPFTLDLVPAPATAPIAKPQ